jgi:hypothetical protein
MALSERDRRTVTIGGLIVGALLAGFVIFTVLGGGEEPLDTPFPPNPAPPSSPSPSPGGGGPPIQNFTGRDPFSVPPALSPSPSPSAPGGGGTGDGDGTGDGNGDGGGTQTPPTTPGDGSSQNVGGSTVVLLDIFRRDGAARVQVEVDGNVFDVGIGDAFAGGRFELRSVSDNCATFLFGDEQFTLCISPQK